MYLPFVRLHAVTRVAMAVFTPRKTSQLLATGILLILAAICTFVVIFLTYGGKLELTPNLLDNKGELWSAIPVSNVIRI